MMFPNKRGAKEGEEITVVSEALKMGLGLEYYVVVTTKRIALFTLKAAEGFIAFNLTWQVSFLNGVKISSNVGNRGHNSSNLTILRQKRLDDVLGEPVQTCQRFEPPFFVGNDECSTAQRSNSLQGRNSPTGNQSKGFVSVSAGLQNAPFFLRGNKAFAFASSEGEAVSRFAIDGEFKHRSQLTRVHNAICCISRDFDSILHDGLNGADREGITSFGPLVFEHNSVENLEQSSDLGPLYASLERTSWWCKTPTAVLDSRRKYDPSLYTDVLHVSASEGGPNWLIEARASAIFVPPPLPKKSPCIDLARDEVAANVLKELHSGAETFKDVRETIFSQARELNFEKVKKGLLQNIKFRRIAKSDDDESAWQRDGESSPGIDKISASVACSTLSHDDSLVSMSSNSTSTPRDMTLSKDTQKQRFTTNTSEWLSALHNLDASDMSQSGIYRLESLESSSTQHHESSSEQHGQSSASRTLPSITEVSSQEAPPHQFSNETPIYSFSPPNHQEASKTQIASRVYSTVLQDPNSVHRNSPCQGESELLERLDRVENLVGHLLPTPMSTNVGSTSSSRRGGNSNPLESFSFNDAPKRNHNPGIPRDETVDALQEEINVLRKQLAAKDIIEVEEAGEETPGHSSLQKQTASSGSSIRRRVKSAIAFTQKKKKKNSSSAST